MLRLGRTSSIKIHSVCDNRCALAGHAHHLSPADSFACFALFPLYSFAFVDLLLVDDLADVGIGVQSDLCVALEFLEGGWQGELPFVFEELILIVGVLLAGWLALGDLKLRRRPTERVRRPERRDVHYSVCRSDESTAYRHSFTIVKQRSWERKRPTGRRRLVLGGSSWAGAGVKLRHFIPVFIESSGYLLSWILLKADVSIHVGSKSPLTIGV